jgi:hypothetical protein
MKLLLPVLIGAICWPAAATTPCLTAEEAKAIAENATLGEAVSAHRVHHPQTAGFPPWLVLVHMPGQDYGWRCIISRDNGKLLRKQRIPNPPSKVR